MLLHRKSGQRIDLTNKVRATRTLEALGFTCTNANPGWYYDGSVYRQAAANTCRFTSENGRTGMVVEGSDTNQLLYSSEDNAAWVNTAGIAAASATSIINGKTAVKYTAAATTDYVYQDVGVFAGQESLMMIVEQGTAATCDIEFYDTTGAATAGRARLTFSTGAVTSISGAPLEYYSYPVTSSGPNSGKVYIVVCSIDTPTPGNSRRVALYPSTTAAGYTYWHHAQLTEAGQPHSSSVIVTTNAPVTRDADVITSSTIPSWWSNTAATCISTYERIFKHDDLAVLFASTDGTGNNYFLSGLNQSYDNEAVTYVNIGGVLVQATSAQALANGQRNKVASSHKNTATYAAGGGVASANASQAGVPADATRFDIGQALGAVYFLNGRIFDITIRPVAMSPTELANYSS